MSLSRRQRALLSLMLLSLFACASSRESSEDGGQTPTRDAGAADSGADAGSGADAAALEAHPTEIVARNAGPGIALLGNTCGGAWLSLSTEGRRLSIDRSCACECTGDGEQQGCGCPPVCLFTQELLVPGTTRTYAWDGLELYVRPRGLCFVPRALAQGQEVTASVCYGYSEQDGTETCESASFRYGASDADDVEVVITPDEQMPTKTAITLENQTGEPVAIVVDSCGTQEWLDLDGVEHLSLRAPFCACSCSDDFQAEDCPTCGGCADDVVETLQVGQRHTFEWNGRAHYTYDDCTAAYAVPVEYRASYRVCYRKPGATEPTCTRHASYAPLGQDVTITLGR